jgi:DegV family protein with EDD domain
MIALVTDSNAQLPIELCRRLGVRVVPLTIVLDGQARKEGVDLPLDEFYAALAAGKSVSTAAPSPGEFLAIYEGAAAAGATAVVSIHVGAELSGTLNAARLAAADSPIPVELVDTGEASFPIAACVWSAADAIAAGADSAEAANHARDTARRVGNVFIVGAPDLTQRSGRLATDTVPSAEHEVSVLALEASRIQVIGTVADVDEAIESMTAHVHAAVAEGRQRVGVGDADAPRLGDALAQAITDHVPTSEVVRYRVGPSVAAHTGRGTVGAVYW